MKTSQPTSSNPNAPLWGTNDFLHREPTTLGTWRLLWATAETAERHCDHGNSAGSPDAAPGCRGGGGRHTGRHTHLLGGLVAIILLSPELGLHLQAHVLEVHVSAHRLDVALRHVVGGPFPLLRVQEVRELLPVGRRGGGGPPGHTGDPVLCPQDTGPWPARHRFRRREGRPSKNWAGGLRDTGKVSPGTHPLVPKDQSRDEQDPRPTSPSPQPGPT